MDTIEIQHSLLEGLISTGSIRVRSKESDAPFWYTSSIPGPFYVNVEKIVGRALASTTLHRIDEILETPISVEDKARAINTLMLQHFNQDERFSRVISLLFEYMKLHCPLQLSAISGGERRDWFFSIPLAHLLGVPHVFLFKNGSSCLLGPGAQPLSRSLNGEFVVHVSDIVNTAISYTDRWVPILNKLGAELNVTLTVAVRGEQGVHALEKHHITVISPLIMNLQTFENAWKSGLITKFALDEISLYFKSPKEWTKQLLESSGAETLADMDGYDRVQKSRIADFIRTDPYGLSNDFPSLFRQR